MSAMYRSAEAFLPGEILRDELDERGWTVTEFAEILGRPIQAISEILNGHKEITPATAIDIADALGTSPELWLNLQNAYRLHQLQRDRPASPVERRVKLRRFGPISEMQKRGWLAATKDLDVIEAEVRQLFEQDSLDATPEFAAAARRTNNEVEFTPIQSAWLARVRSVGANMPVSSYDPAALDDFAATLGERLIGGPARLGEIPAALAACGVAFVFVSALKSSKLDGAVLFTTAGTPVIGLTGRYDRFDSFVFTLLHECAHLVLGHVTKDSGAVVDEAIGDADAPRPPAEAQADNQANEWLFPGGLVIPEGRVTVGVVGTLASQYRVHPSVVIGQIQHRRRDYSLLRTHIQKVRPFLEVTAS